MNEEYLFKGPGTYYPRIEETVVRRLDAFVVLPNNAILLRARRNLVDAKGNERKAGEKVRN